ncbi:hypothetical protein C1646_707506 [Rhizophagus diaphanus]|nr:hypothetical protein C1646_707506 [Rhizophagus diaphanus] [Rhizophagus sp. MUCL 43196]
MDTFVNIKLFFLYLLFLLTFSYFHHLCLLFLNAHLHLSMLKLLRIIIIPYQFYYSFQVLNESVTNYLSNLKF